VNRRALIIDGRQPPDLTFEKLTRRAPMSWAEQIFHKILFA
jgi:hypothetical protein